MTQVRQAPVAAAHVFVHGKFGGQIKIFRDFADSLEHRRRAAGEQFAISDFEFWIFNFCQQRLRDKTLFAVAAVLGRRADFPADGGKFLLTQNIHAAAAANENDPLLRRALREQKHRRHAVTAGDEQRRFSARFGTVKPWPSGAMTLNSSPARIRESASVPLPTVL